MRAHVYNSITLLYSRNYHNIVNQLYILSNLKKKKRKEKTRAAASKVFICGHSLLRVESSLNTGAEWVGRYGFTK